MSTVDWDQITYVTFGALLGFFVSVLIVMVQRYFEDRAEISNLKHAICVEVTWNVAILQEIVKDFDHIKNRDFRRGAWNAWMLSGKTRFLSNDMLGQLFLHFYLVGQIENSLELIAKSLLDIQTVRATNEGIVRESSKSREREEIERLADLALQAGKKFLILVPCKTAPSATKD